MKPTISTLLALLLLGSLGSAVIAADSNDAWQNDRREMRQERRDDRQDMRQERREDRREFREERRDRKGDCRDDCRERREDRREFRQDRRDDRQEYRQERREERREFREERRDLRGDRRDYRQQMHQGRYDHKKGGDRCGGPHYSAYAVAKQPACESRSVTLSPVAAAIKLHNDLHRHLHQRVMAHLGVGY